MKLYSVTKILRNDEMVLESYEAEEKPKTYIIKDEYGTRRIPKGFMGQMDTYKIYCMGRTREEAFNGYKDYCEREVKRYQEKIKDFEDRLVQLEKLQKKYENMGVTIND
jgi:DNA mismatch repair ATPase MutS